MYDRRVSVSPAQSESTDRTSAGVFIQAGGKLVTNLAFIPAVSCHCGGGSACWDDEEVASTDDSEAMVVPYWICAVRRRRT